MSVGDQVGTGNLALPLPDDAHTWVVVHSRPRCEKKVKESAEHQNILVYLPLHRRTHHYGARERTFESPMFPGYVFCWTDTEGNRWLGQNRYTARLLPVPDQNQLVTQLRHLQSALQSGQLMEVLPFLETGRRVRVQAGPLRGLEGQVLRIKGHTRIVLNVDMIRESVAVEVDSSLLAPI